MEEMSKTAMETIVDYNQQDDTAHVFTYDPAPEEDGQALRRSS